MTGVETIGAVKGLAGLFNTTITWFDYIQVSKRAAVSLQSLFVKLDAAQMRLSRWGQAVGLTGSEIEDEDSIKNSGSFSLDEEQERHAIQTFLTVGKLFEECQKLCQKGKTTDDTVVNQDEIRPFNAAAPFWNPMHRYLHIKMQDIIAGRKNKINVKTRIAFAIYKREHLENLIKDIDDHIDKLYKIYTPPAEVQGDLGKAELSVLLQVVTELCLASKRDSVIHSAVNNILEIKENHMIFNAEGAVVQQMGQAQGSKFEMTVSTPKRGMLSD
ncbi:hypothetical protein N0V90_005038 [Kalmusia sp. IMI 367209]|nr:hypothetical protein N0V90_005038 [Kalmusia sp. IMI 367209]